MDPALPMQDDITRTVTTTEIMQTLQALQEQVLRLQERQEETLRRGETNTARIRDGMDVQEDRFPSNSVPTMTSARPLTGPKPSPPTDYDGDRAKGRSFLNSVKWYLRSRGNEFRDDAHRIAWTLSFMKGGRALTFVNQVTRHTEVEGTLPYLDWTAFWQELEDRFLPLDEGEEAMNTLETERYFQGKRTVDDFCDQFQDLVDHAGYGSGKQVVMKFRKGLETTVADAVATMKEGRPKDDDLPGWIRAAKDIARQRVRNDAFNVATRKDRYVPKGVVNTTFKPSNPVRGVIPMPYLPTTLPMRAPVSSAAHPTSGIEPPTTTPKPRNDTPVPMEVDASKSRGRFPIVCHRCGQTGHYKYQCPLKYDVRYMSAEELEDCLQEQLTREDVTEAERGDERRERETELAEVSNQEDFQEGNE
jgi:hypothetical protein